MLIRINELLDKGEDFAIETTLATKSYVLLIKRAREKGYKITLVYFWLSSTKEAIDRVATRVSRGGHNIPDEIVERRYYRGVQNLLKLYIKLSDYWAIVNSQTGQPELVISGERENSIIYNSDIWEIIKKQGNDSEAGKY